MKRIIHSEKGFTLIELIIVLGITLLILGFITINLANFQQKTSVNTTVDTLISDMKNQQAKAMAGAGSGSGNSYGIYFQPDRYILFTGSSYSSTNSSNFTVRLDATISFTNITLPSNVLVFLRQSGEINGFTNGSNTITVKDTQGSNKQTITINKYGVVTSVN